MAAFQALAPTGIGGGMHNENQEKVDFLIQKNYRPSGGPGPRGTGMSRPPIAEALAMVEIYGLGVRQLPRPRGTLLYLRAASRYRGLQAPGHESDRRKGVHYLMLDERT